MSTLKVDTITDEAGTGAPTLSQGLTVAGNVSVDGGTIKLDGAYPIGTANTALGDAALDSLTTGGSNVAIGNGTLTANTSGNNNIGMGRRALLSNTSGGANVGIGLDALYSNTTASYNTAVGYQSSYSNTTGLYNNNFGATAGYSTTTGTQNQAMGNSALYYNSTGSYNVALGGAALFNNTTASSNTAVGYHAGYSNTTGSPVTAMGYYTLDQNTTGVHNNAYGYRAMRFNTTGGYNTALGGDALYSNTTANYNTAVGYQAGYSNTTQYNNVAVGYQALYSATTNVGYNNTAVGYQAGHSLTTANSTLALGTNALFNTTGNANTGVGQFAGYYITTGSKNTILGRYNGNQGGLDIRTSSNNIVLSNGDGDPRVYVNGSGHTLMGGVFSSLTNSAASGLEIRSNGQLKVGGSAAVDNVVLYTNTTGTKYFISHYQNGTYVGAIIGSGTGLSLSSASDYRLKENVSAMTGATERLKQLNPSRFNFVSAPDTTVDGFLAHEVQTVVPEAVVGTKDAVDADGNPVYQGIDQSKLVPLLVATIKELEARITALEAN